MKTIALIFILSILTQQALSFSSISFSGNVTKDETSGVKTGEFDFRATNVWLLPINLGFAAFTLGCYSSLSVNAKGSNGTGQVNANLIVGAIKFFSGQLPLSYMGYLNAQLTATRTVVPGSTDVTKVDLAGSGGFILTSYNAIEERTQSGAVVRTVKLKELVWSATAGNSTNVNGGMLHYVTLTAQNPSIGILEKKILQSSENVAMTFLVSEVLGVVKFGSIETSVTPKTLESVLEINGWSYSNTQNHLVFVCGVLTGSATGESSGLVTFASGSGENQVYAHFSGSVDVSGTKKKSNSY